MERMNLGRRCFGDKESISCVLQLKNGAIMLAVEKEKGP